MADSNGKVVQRYVNGERSGFSTSMRIVGSQLMSYNTVVALWLNAGRIAINPKRYSTSTSRQVSKLQSTLAEHGFRATDERIDPPASGERNWQSDEPFVVWAKS